MSLQWKSIIHQKLPSHNIFNEFHFHHTHFNAINNIIDIQHCYSNRYALSKYYFSWAFNGFLLPKLNHKIPLFLSKIILHLKMSFSAREERKLSTISLSKIYCRNVFSRESSTNNSGTSVSNECVLKKLLPMRELLVKCPKTLLWFWKFARVFFLLKKWTKAREKIFIVYWLWRLNFVEF